MSRATVIDFPRRKVSTTLPDYRLASGAYYIALDALTRLDDLECRLEACRSLSRTSRRRLSSIATDVATTLDAVLASVDRLP